MFISLQKAISSKHGVQFFISITFVSSWVLVGQSILPLRFWGDSFGVQTFEIQFFWVWVQFVLVSGLLWLVFESLPKCVHWLTLKYNHMPRQITNQLFFIATGTGCRSYLWDFGIGPGVTIQTAAGTRFSTVFCQPIHEDEVYCE